MHTGVKDESRVFYGLGHKTPAKLMTSDIAKHY